MPFSTKIIRLLNKVEEPVREVLVAILEEIERQRRQWEETVTRKEFNELKEIVADLRRTVNELAEAQKRTEQKLNDLAEAQKKTEEELRKLIGEHRKTRDQFDHISHVGEYILEDKAYEGLPPILKKEFGIEVKELKRDFIEIAPEKYEEINIIGKGKKDGTSIWIIGECKTQLKKRDVDNFLKEVSRIEKFFPGEKILVAVTYTTSPKIKKYAEEKGIKLYFSYQFKNVS